MSEPSLDPEFYAQHLAGPRQPRDLGDMLWDSAIAANAQYRDALELDDELDEGWRGCVGVPLAWYEHCNARGL